MTSCYMITSLDLYLHMIQLFICVHGYHDVCLLVRGCSLDIGTSS